jgi:hypothetical protein
MAATSGSPCDAVTSVHSVCDSDCVAGKAIFTFMLKRCYTESRKLRPRRDGGQQQFDIVLTQLLCAIMRAGAKE